MTTKGSALRSKLISGSAAKPKRVVTIDLGEEKFEVELRQPSIATQSQILIAAGLDPKAKHASEVSSLDVSKLAAQFIVQCAYAPGTDERVFTDDDLDLVRSLGPALDELEMVALDLVQSRLSNLGNGSRATQS